MHIAKFLDPHAVADVDLREPGCDDNRSLIRFWEKFAEIYRSFRRVFGHFRIVVIVVNYKPSCIQWLTQPRFDTINGVVKTALHV